MLALNLRSAAHRAGSTAIVLMAFAVTVLVFLSVYSMAHTFEQTIANVGAGNRALILRQGSVSVAASTLSMEDVDLVRRSIDRPLTAELITMVRLRDARGGIVMAQLRGVESGWRNTHPGIDVLTGRMFTPGAYEVVVGRQLARQSPSAVVGGDILVRGTPWHIVGIFESNADAHESEVLTDLPTLMTATGKRSVSVLTVRLGGAFPDGSALEKALAAHERLGVSVESEVDYFRRQSGMLGRVMFFMAYGLAAIMGLGALVGALNSMYSALDARRREIGTLLAIGVRSNTVTLSFLVEAALLACAGAMFGVGLGWVLFDGRTVSTVGETFSFTQLAFELEMPYAVAAWCVGLACAIGALGALVPALRAGAVSPARCLRAQ
jgi:putative ABC transport system permease protein